MKLLDYYLAAFLPLLVIFLLLLLGYGKAFAISMILYYVYRVLLDFYKLNKNGIIKGKDVWQFILPVWTFLHFRELYCK